MRGSTGKLSRAATLRLNMTESPGPEAWPRFSARMYADGRDILHFECLLSEVKRAFFGPEGYVCF